MNTKVVHNRVLTNDAWQRPKAILDYSILSGLWTSDIPNSLWKTCYNTYNYPDSADNLYANSVEGMLVVDGAPNINDCIRVNSRRHPRYQPNRGHLYSTSVIIPDPTKGIVDFGLFTFDNGVFFRVKEGNIYACLKSLGVIVKEELIKTDVDLTRGNIYDIQFQWRGVGDYCFFINQQCVHRFYFLGSTEALSVANPSLPLAISVTTTEQGVSGQVKVGCVDVSSEGGVPQKQAFRSIVNNRFSASNEVIMAVRIPTTLNGWYNTRDVMPTALKADVSKKSTIKVYYTRDGTALTGGTWEDINGGHIQTLRPTTSGTITFDDTKADMINSLFCNSDRDNITKEPNNEPRIEFFLTNGDYLIFYLEGSAVEQQIITHYGEEV